MLTSKEIIERTGISRATLNNYIASGLVPRPQVLPPGPEDGAAPRIGYFPDHTITRVETIQRLKREGWSITRIAEHFAGNPMHEAAAASRASAGSLPAPLSPPPPALPPAGLTTGGSPLRLSLRDLAHPAYFVADSFHITWLNDDARASVLSPLNGAGDGERGSIFPHLLRLDEARGRDTILQFHLEAAKARSGSADNLFSGLRDGEAGRLETLYRQARVSSAALASHARVPAGAATPARLVYAMQFREGVLFAYVRDEAPPPPIQLPRPRAVPAAPQAPAVTSIAVLASTLQDADTLWVKLTAHEYFELVNEVWAELDAILRRHRGRPGRHPDEGLVCYFLPAGDGNYVWNALAAAQEVREAMRGLSLRWQARKGWDLELCMNTGLDEGQDWMGAIGAGVEGDLRVLGDAAERAAQLSRCSRSGAILVTRGLLGKLPEAGRGRIAYGVPRPEGTSAEARLLFTFARLDDIAPAGSVPPHVAGLAVAEVLDLKLPLTVPPAATGAA